MIKRLHSGFQTLAGTNPVLVAFFVFIVAAAVVVPISMIFWTTEPESFLKNVVAESHGTLFDLFIIGWFLMWLGRRADRAMTARRYREEIDDFLGWKSPEASHRIAVNLRKLNRMGTSNRIRLTEAFLRGANLTEIRLVDSDLWGVDFTDAMLEGADFSRSNLGGSTFERALLQRADIHGVDARGANFVESELKFVDFRESDLRGVDMTSADLQFAALNGADLRHAALVRASFRQCDMTRADLSGADCRGTSFEDANLTGVRFHDADLREAYLIGATFGGRAHAVRSLARARSLAGARLDDDIMEEIRASYPSAFEEPDATDDY